jgi:ISXO2 transposase-like protein
MRDPKFLFRFYCPISPHREQLRTFHFSTEWKHTFYDTELNLNIPYAKHAISVDENRKDFARVKWGVPEDVSHKVSLPITDQWVEYNYLRKEYPHSVIDHAKGKYVIGAINTNTIEGFWSLIKRGAVSALSLRSAKSNFRSILPSFSSDIIIG